MPSFVTDSRDAHIKFDGVHLGTWRHYDSISWGWDIDTGYYFRPDPVRISDVQHLSMAACLVGTEGVVVARDGEAAVELGPFLCVGVDGDPLGPTVSLRPLHHLAVIDGLRALYANRPRPAPPNCVPPNYGCPDCEQVEVTMLGDSTPKYMPGRPCPKHSTVSA